MTVQPLNFRQRWTCEDDQKLQQLAADKLPVSFISRQLRRTEKAVKRRATEIGIPLRVPKNLKRKRGINDGAFSSPTHSL